MSKKDISLILKLEREDAHREVVKNFMMLDEQDRLNEMVMMAYADALYELEDDLAALDAYLRLVMQHAKGRTVDVALFGAAMALKNLDLQEEAFELMQLISPQHQGLDREVEHSHKILGKQAKAKDMLDGLKQFKRFSLN